MRPDLSRLARKLRLPFWHRADIEAEIESHLREAESEEHTRGADEPEARRSALERLGDLESLGDSLQAVHHGWIGGATVQRRFARVLLIAVVVIFAGIGLMTTVSRIGVWKRTRGPVPPLSSPAGTPALMQLGYELAQVSTEAPLTPQELEAAFSQLGLKIKRFAYEVPFTHRLSIGFQQFVDGKLAHESNGSAADRSSGKHNLMLLLRPEADCFTLGSYGEGSSGYTTTCGFSLGDYRSKSECGVPESRLVEGKKVPLYVLVGSRSASGEMCGLDPHTQLDEMVKKYDMVLVVSAELQRIKAIGARP